MVGMSHLSAGRWHRVIRCGIWVPAAARLVANCYTPFSFYFILQLPRDFNRGNRARMPITAARHIEWQSQHGRQYFIILENAITIRLWFIKLELNDRDLLVRNLHKTISSAIAEEPRDASCQLKSCQLPSNSAETTYTRSPDQIDGMKLEI